MANAAVLRVIEEQTGSVGEDTAIGLSDAVFGFTADELAAAQRLVLQPFTAALRYDVDGTVATTGVDSHLLAVNALLTIEGNNNISNLSLIADTATPVDLHVTLLSDVIIVVGGSTHVANQTAFMQGEHHANQIAYLKGVDTHVANQSAYMEGV